MATWWIVFSFFAVLVHIKKIQGNCVTPICINKLTLFKFYPHLTVETWIPCLEHWAYTTYI